MDRHSLHRDLRIDFEINSYPLKWDFGNGGIHLWQVQKKGAAKMDASWVSAF